jgi:UDP-N-acetylglucosamine 1-carboxyvinyltransferase
MKTHLSHAIFFWALILLVCLSLAAALLAPGVTTLRNMDRVVDLDVMIDVLRAIGAGVEWIGPAELQIDATEPLRAVAPYELVTRMRASINVLGPLLAR